MFSVPVRLLQLSRALIQQQFLLLFLFGILLLQLVCFLQGGYHMEHIGQRNAGGDDADYLEVYVVFHVAFPYVHEFVVDPNAHDCSDYELVEYHDCDGQGIHCGFYARRNHLADHNHRRKECESSLKH